MAMILKQALEAHAISMRLHQLGSQTATKPCVFILIGHYLPGYKAGGPIRSISNLVEALGDEVEFRIVTSDRDLGDPYPYEGIQPCKWVQVGKAQVMYVPPTLRSLWKFTKTLCATPADTMYLNSFFARRFSMLPLVLRRLSLFRPKSVVLAPRGEFSAGALRFKSWRKRLYIALARSAGVYQDVLWHASSSYEERDIRMVFRPDEAITVARPIPAARMVSERGHLEVITAPDLPKVNPRADTPPARQPKKQGAIRLAFLSRISRKKNLDGAIAMLSGLSGDVHFSIYGTTEDRAYWEGCQAMISRLPANVHAEYRGEVSHVEVEAVLANHDAFFFPTHGENYGHVIQEALLAGCPVIISDQTPWRDLEAKGVGWDLPLQSPQRFRQALQTCIDMPPERFSEWSHRAYQFGLEQMNNTDILDQNRKLFQQALQRTAPSRTAEWAATL